MATDVKNDGTLSTSLVNYWEMEETSGTRTDSHGANDLTDNNTVTSATGLQGNAAHFVTGNSEFFTQASVNPSGSGDWSFAFPIKIGTSPASGVTYCLFSHYMNTGNQRSLAMQYRNNAGTLQFYVITSANGSTTATGTLNYTLTAGTWYGLVFAYDMSAGNIEIFVNGSSIGSITGQRTSLHNSTTDFRIGAIGDGGTSVWFFDGDIDDFGLWSRLLDATDASALWNSGAYIPYEATATATFKPRIIMY